MLKKKLNIFDKKKKDASSGSDGDTTTTPSSPSSIPPLSSGTGMLSIANKFKSSNMTSGGLSSGLETVPFRIDELQSYGIAGKVKTLAFDPLQSLMAVVTEFNHIQIFGQSRVSSLLKIPSVNAITTLKFIKGVYLVAVDNLSTIFVISLHSKKIIHTIISKMEITAFESDYSLEFVYVGLKNGYVKAYDIETGRETILNLTPQQYGTFPSEIDNRVSSIKINPRDLGTLLISYSRMSITFHLPQNKVTHKFIYKVPKGAPGGENSTYDYDAFDNYVPKVTHSLWHPNGLHMVTFHNDNSIVFWDALTGEKILARTIFDSYVDELTGNKYTQQENKMTAVKKACWLCESDPERTSLLICGGDCYEGEGYHQLVRMDFGKMLSYSMTSYANMAKYYAHPAQQNIFAIHSPSSIVDYVPLGEKSPYFSGNHDPKLIAIILADGSLKFLNYPMGNLSFNASYFPSTISWLNPKITYTCSAFMDRRILNTMIGIDKVHRTILKGGIPSKPKFKADIGSLVISGHQSGFIRLWNSSEGDLDSSTVFEIDISQILLDDALQYSVSNISFASDQLELACSLYNDDVLLFSYQQNPNFQPNVTNLTRRMGSIELSSTSKPQRIIDISDRAPRDIKKGFLPKALVKSSNYGKVTSLCNSNVGFVGIGYESGQLTVVDRRGNVAIFNSQLADAGLSIAITPTAIEFAYGVIGEGNSTSCSVIMYVGTSIGRLLTYQVVADLRGRYSVIYVDSVDSNDSQISNIIAINSITGRPSTPTIKHLRSPPSESDQTQPLVITASSSDIRVLKNGKKSAHKTYSKGDISKVGITGIRLQTGNNGFCIVAILGTSKKIITLSLPSLSELSNMRIPYRIEPKFADQSSVLPLGDIFLRINETEAVLVNIMNARRAVMGLGTGQQSDKLFLQNILIPYRPAMSQFVKGATSFSYPNLFRLLVGRDRADQGKLEEYSMAWSISPYNPKNYTLVGTTPPKYFDPNALHQHPDLNSHPVAPVNLNGISKNVARWGQSAQNTFDRTTSKVETYVSDINDDFDKMMAQAKSDAIKGVVGGKLGF